MKVNGKYEIIDRKNNIIKLSQGEFFRPESIGNIKLKKRK
jgi:long-subunit acyl-CoA synthetase (AMP-forming)